jgi:alcohol dehydrogenase (cytochrome c)
VPATEGSANRYFRNGNIFGPAWNFSGIVPRVAPGIAAWGTIRAIAPESGKIQWDYRLPSRPHAGVLSTAGGLVFSGSDEGRFFALDASTGKELWHAMLGGMIIAGPITYLADGRQQIAIAAGNSLFSFELQP